MPLKAEYYKALAHYHASKSLPASGEMHERRDGDKNVDAGILLTGAAAAASGGSATMVDAEVDTGQAKMAHIKESLACHDEAQRLQRMCRELKVRVERYVLYFLYSQQILVLDTNSELITIPIPHSSAPII